MTQECLAESLSVSPQAVSRWETGMAMPDISLLPSICNLFCVTSDELLGINIARRTDQIQTICQDADKYSQRGYFKEAREILEEGLTKYPDQIDIVYHLMELSFSQYTSCGEEKYLNEAICCGEKVLKFASEDSQRQGAIQVLCFSYCDAGHIEEAVKLAESMPFLSSSREVLLSQIQTGDAQYQAKQVEAYNLLQLLSNCLVFLQTKLDSGENAYTEDECAVLREKQIFLLNLFFEDGDFGFYHTHLCDAHFAQALFYAKKGEQSQAIHHLETAAIYAEKFISSRNEKPTSLVFRSMSSGGFATNTSDNDAKLLLEKMQASVFDPIRQTEGFIQIQKQLKQVAGQWTIAVAPDN